MYQPHAKSKGWDPKARAYGRFWLDVPGQNRRQRTVSLGQCTTRSIARQRLREHLELIGVNSKQTFLATTSPAMTFRQQAEQWLESMTTRRRKPVKPATIWGWRHSLNKWLLPNLGDMLLADVGNAALKSVVEKMAAAGLSPQSIVTHSRVVKMVVASAVNEEGEQIYARTWNHDFCGVPIIDPTKQRRPTVTKAELEVLLTALKSRYAVLVALLAGTGLRIGEVLGLKTTDLSPDCRVIHVQRSVWHGREQTPKTSNALRIVDLPESLAKVLRQYIEGKNGYLFSSKRGNPLLTENVRRVLRRATDKSIGFHCFRRYRAAVLRKARVPEHLVKQWLGHARNLGDHYAMQLENDIAYRQEWAKRVGLGFDVCDTCDTTSQLEADNEKAA